MGGETRMTELVLTGVDGGNPLGFLTAVGTVLTARQFAPDVRIFWRVDRGAWRPVLSGCESNQESFVALLHQAIAATCSEPFTIDKKLPFSVEAFVVALHRAQHGASSLDRRLADFLAAFGSEVFFDPKDKERTFEATSFCMVRSGDSKGQGLPFYAVAIRNSTDLHALRRALFEQWKYQDVVTQDREEKGYSMRWDPLEDQRYALRWHDPSGDKSKHALKTMVGANALALEALTLFPTAPRPGGLATTGFLQLGRQEFFTWPIWKSPVSPEMIRSLLSLAELHEPIPPRRVLAARGIAEVYRCERVAPNKYYKNFSPAIPA
jgi:hypothetical protein